ncbi:MAG: DUF92 domain-containing protein [Gemmatimonadaceae bacterium]
MFERALTGLVIALCAAAVSLRFRLLSRSGAIAAAILGTLAVMAGWSWGVLLMAFFASSSALTRMGIDIKEARTNRIVSKRGARDPVQVLANGAVLGAAALASLLIVQWHGWLAIGAGAIAAATADTWATELGILSGLQPRMLTTLRKVPPGTSGGITIAGLLGSAAGSVFVGAVVLLVGWPAPVAVAASAGGLAGSAADSLLGSVWQSRRKCGLCSEFTERRVHSCGTITEHAGGLHWMENDQVNFLSTLGGATVALMVWLVT